MPRTSWLRSWGARSASGIGEQGLYALESLALNVLVARWASREELGRFALLFPLSMLLSYAHNALITDPLLVHVPRAGDPAGHARVAVRLQLLASGPLLVALLAAAGVARLAGYDRFAPVLAAFSLAAPAALLLATLRRTFSALLLPHVSALAGVAYLPLAVGLLWVLRHMGVLCAASAYVASGVTDLAIAALASRWLPRARGPRPPLSLVAGESWQFGRWLLWMAPLRWAPLNVYLLALPLVHAGGTVLAGTLRATMLLVAPVQQVQAALASLLIPTFSDRVHRGEAVPWRRPVLALVGVSLVYFLVLLAAGDRLAAVLYGGAVAAPPGLPALLAAAPLVTAAITVTQAALMASARLRAVFGSYLAGSLVSLTLGLALLARLGLAGVGWGSLLACGAILGVQAAGLRDRETLGSPASGGR